MKDLTIRLKLDRTQERQQTQEAIADAGRTADAFKRATRERREAEKRASKESLTEAQVAEKAKLALIRQTNQQRVKAAVDAKRAESQASESAIGGLRGIAGSTLVAVGAADRLLSVMRSYGQVVEEAARRQRELQRNFIDSREAAAELAAIMGRPADNAFVAANQAFNTRTGMKPGEGLDFRSAFQNQGAQFAGKNMTQAEFDQFEAKSAQLALARKIDPGIAGQFFGGVAGQKNFGQGDQAAEDALAIGNASIEILKRGAGDNAVLVRQLTELNSSLLNDDALRGVVQSPNETAMLISAAAERSPSGAKEMTAAALRGLRDFNGDAKSLLDAAQVTPQTGTIQALRAIAPIVEKEARESGAKVDDVLKKYFHDHLTAEGIGVFLNKGVSGGIFADREALLAGQIPGQPAIAGPAAAQATIDAHLNSERGMVRSADALTEQQMLEKGGAGSAAELLRRQAINNLTRSGKIGTTEADSQDWWSNLFGLGLTDSKERRIDEEQVRMLQERGKARGVDINGFMYYDDNSVEGKNRATNAAMDQIRAAGGNPLVDALAANTAVVAENNRLMQQQQNNPNRTTPIGPPLPPAPGRGAPTVFTRP